MIRKSAKINRRMNKKGAVSIFLLLLGVALSGLFLAGKIDLGSVLGGYDSVYKPWDGHVCCLEGALEDLTSYKYADDATSYTCSTQADSCNIQFKYDKRPWTMTGDVCYSINGIGKFQDKVIHWDYNNAQAITLNAGDEIEFISCGWLLDARPYYQWKATGKLYRLIGEENGKIYTSASDGCYLNSELKGKVLSESPNPIPKGYTYCQNYFTDFVQVATKTYSYSGQKVVCQAKELYAVDTEELENGNSVQIQGERIKAVECCPTEPNCDSSFQFKVSVTRECDYSYQCANSGNLYGLTQTTAKYFACESGKCVEKIKDVECTSDAVCITRHGAGYVCDLTPANWGTCKESAGGVECGDGYCDIGESKATCPADCELECQEGEKIVTKTKNVNCKVFGLFFCDEEVSKSCESSSFNVLKIIAIIVLIVGGGYVLIRFVFPYLAPLIRKVLPF